MINIKKTGFALALAVTTMVQQPVFAHGDSWVPLAAGAIVGTAVVAGAVIASQQQSMGPVYMPQPVYAPPQVYMPPQVYGSPAIYAPPVVIRSAPNIYTAPFIGPIPR